MHIPDGFIADSRIWMGCFALSAPVLLLAARRSRDKFSEEAALLPGMTGAFLFAAQMFNFPVLGGTSGHLLGGVLACALLGGATGTMVVSLVLLLQCLLFQDGGITALGANILNMALIGGGGAYLVYRILAPMLPRAGHRMALLGGVAALGVVAAAGAAALEIGLGGAVPVGTALTAMLTVHIPIALVEGLATVAVLRFLRQWRPDLIRGFDTEDAERRSWLPVGGAVLALCVLAVLFASGAPDGLESVAHALGFESRAETLMPAPFPDYALESGGNLPAQIAIAVLGLAAVLLAALGLGRLLRRTGESA